MSQTPYSQPQGHPMRRFALFVAILAVIVAAGSRPRHSTASVREYWQCFRSGFHAHAKSVSAATYGAALGTADGWTIHDCNGEGRDQTHWGWGKQERACEMR